jgi:hypothetical protein
MISTVSYTVKSNPTNNDLKDLYELVNNRYKITKDTVIDNSKTYYTQEIGYNTLTITCGVTSITIRVQVLELDLNIAPITTNLALDFNPAGKSNDDASSRYRAYIPNETVLGENEIAVSSNFDWNNGGWKLDDEGNTYFCVKSGSRAYINYELFNRDLNIATNG